MKVIAQEAIAFGLAFALIARRLGRCRRTDLAAHLSEQKIAAGMGQFIRLLGWPTTSTLPPRGASMDVVKCTEALNGD
jgi:hypothetical protein